MKKILIACLVLATMIACNQSGNKPPEENTADASTIKKSDETDASSELSKNPDYKKGLALEATSGCIQCHKIDDKLIGPSYRDIAAKYPINDAVIDSLSEKIIKGGSGNWGQIPMIPHPDMPKEDAKAITKYILLLKK